MKPEIAKAFFAMRHIFDAVIISFAFALALVFIVGNAADAQPYYPGQFFGTSSTPEALVVADINGDGKPDVVTVNYGLGGGRNGSVSILLGNGDGTFQTKKDFAVGQNPDALAVADFNGDGKPDIVVVEPNSYTLSVLFGNGDGTFQTRVVYSTGLNTLPTGVAVGDLNGDGKPDIVTTNIATKTVSVFLNDGNGVFPSRRDYSVAVALGGLNGGGNIAIADFNGDGIMDIVVAGSGINVLLGKSGDGTLQTAVNYPGSGTPTSLAVADFNGDGKLDVVTANYNSTGTVSLFLGNGDGSFQPEADHSLNTKFITFADVDGDGKHDLLCPYNGANIAFFKGNGDGTFQSAMTFASNLNRLPSPGFGFAVGDLNHDGKLDVVTANDDNAGTLSVLIGTGDGSFPTHTELSVPSSPFIVVMADINGDGNLDLITAHISSTSITVLLGNGDGTFKSPKTYNVGVSFICLAVADINGDGLPDIIGGITGNRDSATGAYSSKISVLLGNGNGTFQARIDYPVGSYVKAIVIADIDGDGKPDIVTANRGASDGAGNFSKGTVSVFRNAGNGSFLPRTDYTAGTPYACAIGDMNGDGYPDIITTNEDVLLNNHDGTFHVAKPYPDGDAPSLAVADVNGDGKLDLILPSPNKVVVLLGNGDGTFSGVTSYASNGGLIAAADVNGDGKPDILSLAASLSVLLNVNNAHKLSGHVNLEELDANAIPQNVFFEFRSTTGSFTRSTLIGANSLFLLSNVPANAYTIHIKGTKYLAQNTSANLVNSDYSSLNVTLSVGDADNNNIVDIGDFGLLVNAFGSNINDGSGYYDVRADFNGDGVVDIGDFGLLVANFGDSGDP